ncbi:PREDICTED: nuclear receptor subfamily 2 group E member 1-like [Nicrophorus vespilloides]|uniref:Nuclear receptor subfamily 2 group E member 1-like n=1 Tax=Nicrophorus vespilloides TaxID=110193 RepID=A0ABM1M033_NICVS|nr:PREDICTED: nuclear receptor subfamily 2 group E member 1-like [Nicrophorus vespilloides]
MMSPNDEIEKRSTPSSRILDIPCKVCGDYSSGKHYNIFACDGCAGFFKRSIRRNRHYACKAKEVNMCIIDKTRRNQCRACRLAKCQKVGMNRDAVQHERGPRNSTIRRQIHFVDSRDSLMHGSQIPPMPIPMITPPLNPVSAPLHFGASASFICNPIFAGRIQHTMAPYPNIPSLPSMIQSQSTLSEQAARLLFMNVKWAKSIASFTSLPLNDQHILLENSWKEMFIVGASQYLPIDFAQLMRTLDMSERNKDETVAFLKDITNLQNSILNMIKLRLDPQEYAYLRGMCLYKTFITGKKDDDELCLTNRSQIIAMYNHTQLSFHSYVNSMHLTQNDRFTQITDLLPSMAQVEATVIEDLFFRKTIGQIPIVRIISDMYKAQ